MSKIKKLLNYVFIDDVLKNDVVFLRDINIFSHLSDRSLAKIALIIFKKNYLAGETVYKEKQEANVLYIVKSGEISVKNTRAEKIVEEKDFFGEISLVENRRHDSTATALKDSELYLIYRVKFDDMVDSNPKVGLRIMRNLSSILEIRLKCAEQETQPMKEEAAAVQQKQDDNDRIVK